MSELKESLEIYPPIGMYWPNSRKQSFTSKIQRCNVCNGSGGKYNDEHSGHEGYEACKMCGGTGEIQCIIETNWIAVGKVKEQFKTIEK